jgi:hypothetical protein
MDYSDKTTDQILQMYSNAYITMGCNGHYKGKRNEELMYEHALELQSRDIIVPKTFWEKLNKLVNSNVIIPEGIFNGEGTF